jgi:WD40 repeat protein
MSNPDVLARSPYIGLVPYAEEDALFFFGRARERDLIIANLLASRLTLLYGPSGVGKSSVLRAGVVQFLRSDGQVETPDPEDPDPSGSGLAVVVFNSWRDDPMIALNECIAQALTHLDKTSAIEHESTPSSLVEMLQSWTDRISGHLLIILDQFEEFFLYHGHADGDDTFARQFPRAVNRHDLNVNFLISIREDALAKLDRFKGRIPNLFDNYLRVEHLSHEAARAAIEGPITQYNKLVHNGTRFSIEPELVDAVLQQVRTGQLVVGQTGSGAVKGAHREPGSSQIETSHLQLVMTRLWNEETSQGSRTLRFTTLERLGGAEHIVQAHLNEAMSTLSRKDRDLAARVFNQLVTPSGTKIAHTVKDLAEYADSAQSTLMPVLERLSASDLRILRPVEPAPDQPEEPRFEIFHDVLAAAVLDWRARHVHDQEQAQALKRERHAAEERARRKRRRTVRLTAVMMALLLVMAVFAWNIDRAARATQSRALAAQAIAQVGSDPAASVRMALNGLSAWKTDEAEDALRRALQESHVRAVMNGPGLGITSVATSPDGSVAVTAGMDATAQVWRVSSGQPLVALSGHTQQINAASFSPDGTRIVTASHDGTARIWDARVGTELARLEGHTGRVWTAAFSPDNTLVVTAGSDGTARIWDARTGQAITLQGHDGGVLDARFSPDGTLAVTAGYDGTVRVWDARTGEQRALLNRHRSSIYTAAFSPDSQTVVTAGSDAHSYLWKWATSEEPINLHHPSDHEMFSAAFSPDGRFVVTAAEKTARVYQADTGRPVSELRGHTAWVNSASFSPDSAWVVTVSRDGTARLWQASNGATLAELRGHHDDVRDATFSPDGKLVITASTDGTARVWEPVVGQALLGYDDSVRSAAFSADGTFVVATGRDGNARIWRTDDGSEQMVLMTEGDASSLNDATFSPDGRYVATVNNDGITRVWDWRAATPVATNQQRTQLLSVAFSPRGDLVAIAGGDGEARIWSWQTDQPLRLLVGHDQAVNSVSFSPDGLRVLTASGDRTVRIWDVATGVTVGRLRGHDGAVHDAAFSPDGELIVTASADRTARIWTKDGEQREVLEHLSWLSDAAFSSDGDRVVTGTSDGITRVWDVTSGKSLAFIRRHGDSVNSATFSPDGQSILTASDDHTVRIYPCQTCGSLEGLRRLAESRALDSGPSSGSH